MNTPVKKRVFLKYTLLKSELLATRKTTAKTLNSEHVSYVVIWCHMVSHSAYGADSHSFL